MFTRFVANSEKMLQIRASRGPAQIIAILHRGGSLKFITILQRGGGGLPDLLQYYKGGRGGGRLGTPNLYYVIYGRPLKVNQILIS